MFKRIIVLLIVVALLSGCSDKSPSGEPTPSDTPPTHTASELPETTAPSIVPTPETPTTTSAQLFGIRASAALEEGCSVISANSGGYEYDESVYVYLYTNEPIRDVIISAVCEGTENEKAELLVQGISIYVPELTPKQALRMLDPYPLYGDTRNYYTQIAYTNSNGKYEEALLLGEDTPILEPVNPLVFGDEYYEDFGLFPEDFKAKLLAGVFSAYIPKGLCIAGGALGDVNDDGTEDALLYFISDSPRTAAYTGIMPLFVLVGQPDGGYVVEKKNAEALFTPYRSSSYPVAGDGYIDIVYDYVGGAACHHTQVGRFLYSTTERDWLLAGFSYQSTYNSNYSENLTPRLVRPLPDFANLPLEKFNGGEYYNSADNWAQFDAVCELVVPSWGEHSEIYTLAVVVDEISGCYEGYIYLHYESLDSGGFIQTIHGEYELGAELVVTSNDEEMAFMIQGDAWKLDEYDSDAFYLAG